MNIDGFKLEYSQVLNDISSTGYLYIHEKTGAKAVVIENEDDNKVFGIGFRTPPENSTGVAHILEHSVLCGSKKYPLKDPFVELVKGSLNTFLNAMTYPDKTVYPVASRNDKDFMNLMDVYLDAVFNPNIYDKKEIFLQEGWHYHIENKEDEIYYNGVVFNEMKGVYSSPESVLYEKISESLFLDTQYGVCSGGNPDNIPDLSYEEFKEFHSKYYHPSNSYIYLYGKMDVKEKLEYIANNYLNNYDKKSINSEIRTQNPFDKPKYFSFDYSISKEEARKNNSYYAYGTVIGDNTDIKKRLALEVALYVLINSTSSNITKEMISKGIVSSLKAQVEEQIKQQFVMILANNCKVDSRDEFENELNKLIKSEIEKGIDKEALLGAINIKEFKYKESDFGATPKGIYYMLYSLTGLLYNEKDAFIHLDISSIFSELKELVYTDYFEKIVRESILENDFKAIVEVNPKQGYNEEIEENIKQRLKKFKSSLSEDELNNLIKETAELNKFQVESSKPEDLAKLPKLSREDIDKNAKHYNIKVEDFLKSKAYFHDYNTNGIAYMKNYFRVGSQYDIRKVAILCSLLGNLDTENYTYQKLRSLININTGGISFSISPLVTKEGDTKAYICCDSSSINQNIVKTNDIVTEILLKTKFEDKEKFKEILLTLLTSLETQIKESGHIYSYYMAAASYSPIMNIRNNIGGVGLYDEIRYILDNFDEKAVEYMTELKNLCKKLFVHNESFIDFIGDEKSFENYKKASEKLYSLIDEVSEGFGEWKEVYNYKRVGIKTPAKIQYVCRSGNYKNLGLDYTGALNVLKTILSFEYLWENVRVIGGAYGCMSGFDNAGISYLVSYRDPNLRVTNEVYEKLPDWLENFDADEDRMFKYVIGTIGSMDTPLSPRLEGNIALMLHLTGKTYEDIQRERKEVLNCTSEDIRRCKDYVKALLDTDAFCVIGNETNIEECKDMFEKVRKL